MPTQLVGRSSDSRAWGAGKGGLEEGLAEGQACQGHGRARTADAPPFPPPPASTWHDPPPPRCRACHTLGRGFPTSRLFPVPLATLTGLAPGPTPSALAAPSFPRGPSLGAGWWAWGPEQAEALELPIRDWYGAGCLTSRTAGPWTCSVPHGFLASCTALRGRGGGRGGRRPAGTEPEKIPILATPQHCTARKSQAYGGQPY